MRHNKQRAHTQQTNKMAPTFDGWQEVDVVDVIVRVRHGEINSTTVRRHCYTLDGVHAWQRLRVRLLRHSVFSIRKYIQHSPYCFVVKIHACLGKAIQHCCFHLEYKTTETRETLTTMVWSALIRQFLHMRTRFLGFGWR